MGLRANHINHDMVVLDHLTHTHHKPIGLYCPIGPSKNLLGHPVFLLDLLHMCSNLQRGTNKKVIASPFVHLMKYDNGNKCYHHLCWQCSQCWRTPGHFFFIITRINSSKKILNKIQNCNTLFETSIFVQKLNFHFPRKLSIFWEEKS